MNNGKDKQLPQIQLNSQILEIQKKHIDLQNKQLDVQRQQIEVQDKLNQNEFTYAMRALETSAANSGQDRLSRDKITLVKFGFALIVIILILVFMYLFAKMGQSQAVIEIIKAIGYILTGGIGGYGLSERNRNADLQSPNEKYKN